MKYIVYLTKNLKSKSEGLNKIYIGVHQTKDPSIFDGYIGCGVYINQPSTYMYPKTPFQYAVKKYGVDAFERTTLYIYDTIKEAYDKEEELVNPEFLKASYTYNACVGGSNGKPYKTIYQFDLDGNLKRKWEYSLETYDFYGESPSKFHYAINRKYKFLDSYWALTPEIDISEYYTREHGQPEIVYLYSKEGKLLEEFDSEKQCAEYVGINDVFKAIKCQSLVQGKYYISKKLVDEYIPKPRTNYMNLTFYIYNKDKEFLGKYIGKEIMNVIDLHSWSRIRDILKYNKGWYKDFYISTEEVSNVPDKHFSNGILVDVYDKYGNFIETLDTVKKVREKYNVPASKIKNIQMGDRYYKDYIFKYHSNK